MDDGGRTPGSEVGGYRILAPLGSGGMGTVYRAVDGGGSVVALKLLHPHAGADPGARDRLRREVAALQRLRHPGVAAVLDAEADSTEAFVVTELVDGMTLEEHVRHGGPLPAVELAELADGLRDALEAVHAAGIVHRDLKPSNVMLTARGPVLIDFGIAQAAEDVRVTSTGFVVGTPGYLAPELLADGDPSAATDWWGWAAVLAYAATGRPPFGSRPLDGVIARTRAGDVDLVGLSAAVAGPLRAALRPEPYRRAAPADVVADLDAVAAGVPPAPPTQAVTRATAAPPDLADDDTRTRVLAQDGRTRAVPLADRPRGAHTAGLAGAAGLAGGADAAGAAGIPAAGVPVGAPGTLPPGPVPAATGVLTGHGASRLGGAAPVAGGVADDERGGRRRFGRHEPVPVAGAVGAGGAERDGFDAAGERYGDGRGGYGDVGGEDGDADTDDAVAPWVPPRLRRRAGTVLALAAAAVAAGMLYPGATILVVLGCLLLVRTVGSAADALEDRRERRGGPARGDAARAVAASPWHLVLSVFGLLPSVLVAAAAVVVVGGVLWWALSTGRLIVSPADPTPDGRNGPLAFAGAIGIALVLGLVTVWFGPLSRLTRIGARRTLGALAPGWPGATVLVTLALAATGVLLVLLVTGQAVTWWPFGGPPVLR